MSSNASRVRPHSLREARDLIAEAHASGSRILIQGAGTAQSWGAPPGPVDLVVDSTGLDELLAYNPADMTVAVGAGMPMSALQTRLDGQRVALDAARIARGATVGGLLATADAGPLRATYGSLRDLVIGVTVVLADGAVARSGGHVIKNVAGYDLAKLFSGSLGTFGLLAEVVLRVHPEPEDTATLAVGCDVGTGFDLTRALFASPLEPVAADWHSGGTTGTATTGSAGSTGADGTGRLFTRFEGTASGVADRLGKAAALVDQQGVGQPERLSGAPESAAWQEIARSCLGAAGDTVFRAGTRPDRLPELAERLDRLAAAHGVRYELTSSASVGVHTVRLLGSGSEDAAGAHAEVLRAWRDDAQRAGGSVTVHRATGGLHDLAPAWGAAPGAVEVLRALKRQLDPNGRLAPGRFTPWLGGIT